MYRWLNSCETCQVPFFPLGDVSAAELPERSINATLPFNDVSDAELRKELAMLHSLVMNSKNNIQKFTMSVPNPPNIMMQCVMVCLVKTLKVYSFST